MHGNAWEGRAKVEMGLPRGVTKNCIKGGFRVRIVRSIEGRSGLGR